MSSTQTVHGLNCPKGFSQARDTRLTYGESDWPLAVYCAQCRMPHSTGVASQPDRVTCGTCSRRRLSNLHGHCGYGEAMHPSSASARGPLRRKKRSHERCVGPVKLSSAGSMCRLVVPDSFKRLCCPRSFAVAFRDPSYSSSDIPRWLARSNRLVLVLIETARPALCCG